MRRWGWRCAAVAATVLLLSAAPALGVPTIFVSPAHTQVDIMSYFMVDIWINGEVLGVTGYDLLIDFDESIIQVDDVFEGGLPGSYPGDTFFYWTDQGNPSNALLVNGAVLGGSVDGPGSLVRIRFYASDPGVSPVSFLSVALRDIDNDPIAVTPVGGDVVVTPGVAVEPASWGRVKALYSE